MLNYSKTIFGGRAVNVSRHLAWKYIFQQNKNSFLYTATRLTFLGILIASCALTIALMVTSGFEKTIKNTLQGLGSDILIFAGDGNLGKTFLKKIEIGQKKDQFSGYCPVSLNQVIIENSGRYQTINFKGVAPALYSQVTNILDKIVSPPNLKSEVVDRTVEILLRKNNVIVGKKLAANLRLGLGQEFSVFVPTVKKKKVLLQEKKLKVGALISVGFDEYDYSLIIGSHQTFGELFGFKDGFDSIMIRSEKSEEVVKDLAKQYPKHRILHWTELSPNILVSMKLEQIVISLVILLILLIGVMNIISLIFMKIQTKQRDIAILLTLGMTPGQIRSIFTNMGLIIGLGATLLGEAIAFGVALALKKYDIIQLPQIYVVEKVPVNLDWTIFASVFIFTNLVVYFASLIPARSATKINISQVLRN